MDPQSRHGLRAILEAPISLQQNAESLVRVEVMAAVEDDAVSGDVLAFRQIRPTADNVHQIRRHARGHEPFLDQAVVNDDGVGQVVGLVAGGKRGLLGIQFMERDHARRTQASPQHALLRRRLPAARVVTLHELDPERTLAPFATKPTTWPTPSSFTTA